MTTEELIKKLRKGTGEPARQQAERMAIKMAKEVREDVHVYMHRGWFNMTQGPDLEHAKTSASFIVPFKQKGKS